MDRHYKEALKEWLPSQSLYNMNNYAHDNQYQVFNGESLSMRFGVIQDFAISVEIPFYVYPVVKRNGFKFWHSHVFGQASKGPFDTIQDARRQALKDFDLEMSRVK